MENRSGITLLAMKVSGKAREHNKHQDIPDRIRKHQVNSKHYHQETEYKT